MVLRKLYKAWDSQNKAMVALKLVEMYGFAAASAWAHQQLAVPSSLVRYALIDGRDLHGLQACITCHIPLSLSAHQFATSAVVPCFQHTR